MEYNIILGLNNLIKPSSKKIKFLRGHGELDNADAWIIRDQLIPTSMWDSEKYCSMSWKITVDLQTWEDLENAN